MAFNDLQMKAMSDYSVIAAHKNLAKVDLFAHMFTELDGKPGDSIAVPVYDFTDAGAFVEGTNDYGSGTNEVGGALVTLDQHLVKSVSITDKQLAFTGISWARDTAIALVDNLSRGVNDYVFGLINSTTVTQTEIFNPSTKTLVAKLYQIAAEADLPVDRCVVGLNPEMYASVLGLVEYSMVGDKDYITTGVIKNLFGFKGFVCVPNMAEGAGVGFIALDEAIGVASKYLAPMTEGAYPEAFSIVAEDGFTFGARRFMDLAKGKDFFAMDALFGAKVLQPTKVIRLVEEA